MHSELEKLIDFALADGILTDKEREILYKKAVDLGEDLDEYQMVLEAKLHQAGNSIIPPSPPITKPKKHISQKEGDIKKCPACGAPVASFSTKCSDCGHEFRNTQALSSKQKMYDDLDKIEIEERARKLNFTEKLDAENAIQRRIDSRKASMIGSFPLPNSKEDILEFFNLAIAESQKHGGIVNDGVLNKAWKVKAKELKSKIELDLKNDPQAILLMKEYDSSRKAISFSPRNKMLLGIAVGMVILFLFIGVMVRNERKEKNLEFQRIKNVEAKIEKLIENEKYDAALIQVEKITWNVEPNINDKLAKQTKEKKESLKKVIEELKNENDK